MVDIEEQPLPRTFEEFNEQRKAAFIRVKDYKQAGNRLIGFLCSYTPLEIIDAAGASSVALCGTSDEVIPEAEKVLPANLCPLIKSTYGFAYSQKCPFTYFSDMIIGETTCDGKKKMYELLNELKRTHILHLPQGRDRAYEREGWYEECRLLKEELENFYDITITDDEASLMIGYMKELNELTGHNSTPPASGGTYTLDGVQACAYARIRYGGGDYYRITERQRTVLTAMMQKAQKSNILTLNKLINAAFGDIQTSFSNTDLLALATKVFSYDIGDTTGFPYEKTTHKYDKIGDVVIPCDLASNVTQLHQFLFNDENYTPSATVLSNSQQIISNTGYKQGDGH